MRRTGHREHAHVALHRLGDRDHRPASRARLDHDDHFGECRDDPVAHREMRLVWSDPRRVLAEQQSFGRDPSPHLVVFGWIDDVQPAADDADRQWTHLVAFVRSPHPAVCPHVDAAGETRHDGDASRGEFESEVRGEVSARCTRRTRADDRDASMIEVAEVPAHVEHRRSLAIDGELCRVVLAADVHRTHAGATQLLAHLAHEPHRWRTTTERRPDRTRQLVIESGCES